MRLLKLSEVKIKPNRQRKEFDPTALEELKNSIELVGLQHAITVRDEEDIIYLVGGESRLKVITDMHELGVKFRYNNNLVPNGYIPTVTLGELNELEAEEAELDENIKRKDLTWQEKSAALARLKTLREKQAALEGKVHTVADLAMEVKGRSDGSYQNNIRKELIVAKHLNNPVIAKAKSADEAFKLLKREQQREENIKLANEIGTTFNSSFHTVLNMDCLEYMEQTENVCKFDIILTDPPYGMNAQNFNDSAGRSTDINHKYDDSPESWLKLMKEWARLSYQVTKEKAHAYVFCDIDNFPKLKELMREAGWYVFRTPLIHYKKNSGRVPLPDRGPRRCYETILYAIKGEKQITQILPDVIESTGDDTTGHGAQKPLELYINLLQRSARAGDEVLDCFAGSGVILPAAHKFTCKATAIELLPEYYGLCLNRLKEIKFQC